MRAAPSSTSETHHSGELPLTLRSASATHTRKLGEALGALLQPGDILLLIGELGAGKTTLAQGIGAGMGVRSVINSPTFTLLKEHDGRLPLHHFDLYRLDSPDEIYTLGFDEYFQAGGVSIVEWAERGEPQAPGELPPWPESALRLQITATGQHTRLLRLSASGARGASLARAWVRASASREG